MLEKFASLRDAFAMRFKISGAHVNLPMQLRRLPIQLYQSQDYLSEPEAMAHYAQQYLDGAPLPVLVPTRMSYTGWSKANDVFGANVVSLLDALQQSREMREGMRAYAMRGVPSMDYYQAADALGATELPVPSGVNPDEYARIPLAKNAAPIGSFVTADELLYAVRNQIPF